MTLDAGVLLDVRNGPAGEAYFSACGRYRYAVSRVWSSSSAPIPMMMFVGLNPSTADERALDPTLRRIMNFAIREGCGGMWIGNLFGIRATKPANMLAAEDPVGGHWNDALLLNMARESKLHVVGWGAHGHHRGRDREVATLLAGFNLNAFKLTKGGQPGHPLYLRNDTPLEPWGLAVSGC